MHSPDEIESSVGAGESEECLVFEPYIVKATKECYYVDMNLPVAITTKYERVGDVAMAMIHITLLEKISLSPGSVIVVNPKNPSEVRIDENRFSTTPLPYSKD